tara:strand:- start:106 stop:534 length:429 start_codon:yes stop_codon:yes gene_type:complete
MSLALIQTPAGLTFNTRTVSAAASGTLAVGTVVKVDLSELVADEPTLTVTQATASGNGLHGVVTKEITAAKDGVVQLGGIATVTASEDIAEGAPVCPAASGKVETADTGEVIIGLKLTTGTTGAGTECKILLVDGVAVATVA